MRKSEVLILIQNSFATDAGKRLTSADFNQALRAALLDLEKSRPYHNGSKLTLKADQEQYSIADDGIPENFVKFAHSSWGTVKKCYENNCGVRPHIFTMKQGQERGIHFSPAPTTAQLTVWGSSFNYIYRGRHVLNETDSECTLNDDDESLLILRACAELMRLLASRNVVSPVQLTNGLGNIPTSGTPGTMYQTLMDEYRDQI